MGKTLQSEIRKLYIDHSEPANFALHLVGLYLVVTGLWMNETWQVVGGVLLAALGTWYARLGRKNFEKLLGHFANPRNEIIQAAGMILFFWGLWNQAMTNIVLGLAILAFGFYWSKK